MIVMLVNKFVIPRTHSTCTHLAALSLVCLLGTAQSAEPSITTDTSTHSAQTVINDFHKQLKQARTRYEQEVHKAQQTAILNLQKIEKQLTKDQKREAAKAIHEQIGYIHSIGLTDSTLQRNALPGGQTLWKLKTMAWTGYNNHNTTHRFRVLRPTPLAQLRFYISGGRNGNSNGHIILTTPDKKEITIANWASPLPTTEYRHSDILNRKCNTDGKLLTAKLDGTLLKPGAYDLSFKYTHGTEAALIHYAEIIH